VGSAQMSKSQPPEPKNALVATIHAIKTLALPMMDTGCGQMRDPLHCQKQREQQAIQMRSILNPTGFDVPAITFAILKGRFHTHTLGIDLHLSASGILIVDEQPRLLTAWVPHEADVRVQRLLLPDPGFALPARAWFEHDVLKALPRLFQFPVEETPIGMLPTDAQQRVPAAIGRELDQGHTC
jgi:hypothetical protein